MNDAEKLIQTRISAYGNKYSIIDFALETNIYNANHGNENVLTISFLGRKIIWTNPEQDKEGDQYAQRVTIDWLDQVGYADFGIVAKFLSALCFLVNGLVLNILFNAAGPFPGPKCPHKTKFSILNGYEIDTLFKSADWEQLSDSDWIKLAHYRQGENSRSSYFAFLSFWNILEVHFNRNYNDIKKYINEEIQNMHNFSEWKTKTSPDFHRKLRKTRNQAAHALLNDNPGSQMQNPDNPLEYMEMSENKLLIKELSEKIINSCLYKK